MSAHEGIKVMTIEIIPREAWGAVPPKPTIKTQEYKVPLPGVIDYVVVHKTDLPRNFSPRDLQRYFQQASRYPWDDVAYQYYITWDGKIYEGREMRYVGGHAGRSKESLAERKKGNPDEIKMDPDYGSIGIALAGIFADDLNKDLASKAQIESLRWLIGHLRAQYPKITGDHVILHKEVDKKITTARGYTPEITDHTNCPGKGVSRQMEKLR